MARLAEVFDFQWEPADGNVLGLNAIGQDSA
jgi:hypothetical protein